MEYRSDFKKPDETVSETDNLADTAFFNGEFDPNGEAGAFSGNSEENVESEELQAVSF